MKTRNFCDVIRKTLDNDPELKSLVEAERLRMEWMTKYGLSEDDINYHMVNDPPFDVAEESSQLAAVERLSVVK